MDEDVVIPAGEVRLGARLMVPPHANASVVLAHVSSVRRHGTRDRFIATMLTRAGLATLMLDLLTEEEDGDRPDVRLDVPLLADRLVAATDWLVECPAAPDAGVGYFCTGTGSAAAFVATALRPGLIKAIVSRSGRPDLGGASLHLVCVPTLLIASSEDGALLAANRCAYAALRGDKRLEVVPAERPEGHPLDEEVALASQWLAGWLDPAHACSVDRDAWAQDSREGPPARTSCRSQRLAPPDGSTADAPVGTLAWALLRPHIRRLP